MRIKLNILVKDNKPVGNKWSFDNENRKALPKNIKLDDTKKVINNKYTKEAIIYINKHFPNNYGSLDYFIYPIDTKTSLEWLDEFLKNKLNNFGPYEDAVSTEHPFIYHSVLSPMMNLGLITDNDVITISYNYFLKHKILLSSFEGFIRQIIGWRNYVYMLYLLEGDKMYQTNDLNHNNKIGDIFWKKTNITPIDFLIEKIKKYAYVHHIERLMFLGNFMCINQIHPKEVYKMFMEWTVDAYDWVMVPNIFGMSQGATDIMMTRLYFSSSNYILKMSNFKNDETDWINIWNALYYSFINKHKDILSKNYATAMQAKNWSKKSAKEKEELLKIAHEYQKKTF
jgi:deoxyribodipyrimidine photolyase-related protein